MRQIVIPRYGGPDVFAVREVPDPVPGEGELRIAVRAAGVNFADILARLGLYPDAPRPPMVVGYEVAGLVDAVGPGVSHPAPGARVAAMTHFGGYADRVVVPASSVLEIPPELSDAEAAALPVNYLTAFVALYRLANLTAGETVLIHGAGGGVGIAATQLARLRRASIIGTASPGKHAALRAFGVDHPVDYRRADFSHEVRRLTGGRGVDVALDPIGGRSFQTSYSLLAPLGRLVMYGVSAMVVGPRRSWWRAAQVLWHMPAFKPLSLMNGNRGVFGLNVGHLWDERKTLLPAMTMIVEEARARRLQPILARTFPLEQAADAHRFLQSRSNIGKVVLTV
ncbi:MAG: synaptic vesicle VAT-1 family membrane protein [Betaproteobacteria bacterium]